ncbi:MAG: cellulase family glycosylhydrolase [bacterium]|jgi:endoglucanase|nr:cellulase family glycosylhydrolase [bacterium]
MKRRDFLAATASLAVLPGMAGFSEEPPISANYIPPLKGFNLLEKFTLRQNSPYVEQDFAWMAEWGFDFVRLPTDYRCWTDSEDPYKVKDDILQHIDQVIEWGKQYNIHINLNIHRGPGYCVNPPKEKLDLWTEAEALKQFCFQWKMFAERYKEISNQRLSFDLLNEPPGDLQEETYARVMGETIDVIRSVSPDRLIVVDGLSWGRNPVFSLADKKIAQSTRGYDPFQISHYRASWANGSDTWPVPTWPQQTDKGVYDKENYRKDRIEPWQKLQAMGVGVHVGEWGCYNKTPHTVTLAWMNDLLSLWKEAGWGYALWNLRGSFGIIDSGREDVQYEDFHGHKLDRLMLETLLRWK